MPPKNIMNKIPDQFAGNQNMGPVLGVFRAKATESWISAIIGLMLVFIAILISISSILEILISVARYGPVMTGNTIFWLPIAVILFIFGFTLAVRGLSNLSRCVVIFNRGLAFSNGNRLSIWIWAEIEFFYTDIATLSFFGLFPTVKSNFILKKAAGTVLRVDDRFENIIYLGNLLGQKIPPQQYRRLLKKIGEGTTVELGNLSVNKIGLALNKKQFTWAEIEDVKLMDGYLQVTRIIGGHSGGTKVSISIIPNVKAFYMLASQIIKKNIHY